MTGLLAVMITPIDKMYPRLWPLVSAAVLSCGLLITEPAQARSSNQPQTADDATTLSLTEAQLRVDELDRELSTLTTERESLAKELDQYKRTLAILQRDGNPPEQSSNPAVRTLALEMVSIRERLISVTEREVTLLQEQITRARQLAAVAPPLAEPDELATTNGAGRAMESKPLRTYNLDYSIEQESENVKRLHALLASYYTELQESARTLPSKEELEQRAVAQRDAERLDKIPFSADKVRLNGAEGSTALSQITRRLSDPNIPESRRDMAPICAVKTRLFGSLIASETRSLKPVGKNHFVARMRLQPGDTTLRIMQDRWEIQLPENANAREFLITLYTPPGGNTELHLFAVADLLAEADPHIPAWLPAELKLKTRAG